MPLTRTDLDNTPCACCGGEPHGPMTVRPKCHPEAGVDAVYEGGLLRLECHQCGKYVAGIVVREGLS